MPDRLLVFVILAVFLWTLVMVLFGSWVAEQKGRSSLEGALLGLLFSMFGILIEALLPARRR